MKKYVIAMVLVCGSASFNANAGVLEDGWNTVLSWFGVGAVETRVVKPGQGGW